MLNLAVNARDAMPAGGSLTIETRNVELDGLPHDVAPGLYVLLTVSDTGVGMDAETRAHAFEPFFTTKPAGEGTGLGLATVYGIVSQSRGCVSVYSEPELGTTFKVYLPATGELPCTEIEPAESAPADRASGTVLLVEDERVVRDLVSEILERDGYTVVRAATPEEAFSAAKREPVIDLLLTDVVMPRMSGPEVARALTAVRDGLKVLYMSGYSDAAVLQRGLLEPGTAFLQKPFRALDLTTKVRALLAA